MATISHCGSGKWFPISTDKFKCALSSSHRGARHARGTCVDRKSLKMRNSSGKRLLERSWRLKEHSYRTLTLHVLTFDVVITQFNHKTDDVSYATTYLACPYIAHDRYIANDCNTKLKQCFVVTKNDQYVIYV